MSPIAKLFVLALNLLMLGAVIHWVLVTFFQSSFKQEVLKTREFLDKIYVPFIEAIHSFFKPAIQLQDGRQLDFTHLVILVLLAGAKNLAAFIF